MRGEISGKHFCGDLPVTLSTSTSEFKSRESRIGPVSYRRGVTLIARRLLGRGGAWISPRTDTRNLRRLIAALSPLSTDKQLVRIGPPGDGGYLVPDDLQNIEACFSPGVSFVSGFEKQCADAGMAVFLADASVDGPAESHPKFAFRKKFIGVTSDDNFVTIDGWVTESLSATAPIPRHRRRVPRLTSALGRTTFFNRLACVRESDANTRVCPHSSE